MTDGVIAYHDYGFRKARQIGPDDWYKPLMYEGEAPFPIWLITPILKRCTWLDTIRYAAADWSEKSENQEKFLKEGWEHLPISEETMPYWLDILDVSWDEKQPIETWLVTQGEPRGLLIIWHHGKPKSKREPVSEIASTL